MFSHIFAGTAGVAVSTTGCGEHLVRTFLAKEIGSSLSQDGDAAQALRDVMKVKFDDSEFLVSVREKLGGAICLRHDGDSGRTDFLWTHTTASMGLAFQTTRCQQPTVRMSRLPNGCKPGPGATHTLVERVVFDKVE